MNTTPNRNETTVAEEARLTAFVLGELEASEAAAFARRVEGDETLRREVDAIRRTVAVVTADLSREAAPGLTAEQRATIDRGPGRAAEPRNILYSFATMRNLWAGVGLAAAACLAVVLWPSVSVGPADGLVALESPTEMRAKRDNAPRSSEPADQFADKFAEPPAEPPADEPAGERGASVMRADADKMTVAGELQDTAEFGDPPEFSDDDPDGPRREQTRKTAGRLEPMAPQAAAENAGVDVEKKEQDNGGADRRARAAAGAAAPAIEQPAPARRALKKSAPPGSGGFGLGGGGRKNGIAGGKVAEDETPLGDDAAPEGGAAAFGEPAFRQVLEERWSTFPLDVATTSYDEVRASLDARLLPAKDAVRIEEMVNHFEYDYAPATGNVAFAFDVETNACPWQPDHRLVRIGLRGRSAPEEGEDALIAEAVDVEVDVNPERVASYRLLGYTNQALAPGDGAEEHGVAGAMAAGRTVTALYEIVPHAAVGEEASDEIMTLRLRYREPGDGSSRFIERTVVDGAVPLAEASDDYRFAAAVAWFGLVLRGEPAGRNEAFKAVLALAKPSPAPEQLFDIGGGGSVDRDEFMGLVKRARSVNRTLLREAAQEER